MTVVKLRHRFDAKDDVPAKATGATLFAARCVERLGLPFDTCIHIVKAVWILQVLGSERIPRFRQ